LVFNTDDIKQDASSVSQPPPQPQVFRSFSSLTEALQALREVWHFDSYALEVSLPAVFAVRGQAAWWAAQPHLNNDDKDTTAVAGLAGNVTSTTNTSRVVTVKDVRETLRHQYACQLGDLLGKGPEQESTMRLSFGCRLSSEIENEAQWLAPPPPKIGRKQRIINKRRGQDGSRNTFAAPLPLLSSPTMVSKLALMSKEQFFEKCSPSAVALSQPPPINSINYSSNNDITTDNNATTLPSNIASIVTISPYRQSQYIGGRYIKLQRGLPQSPWFEFNGDRKGGTSVQEEIAKIVLPGLHADGYTFMSSGREDIDVRMLGNGRPFAFEIKNMRAGMPSADTAGALERASILANSGVEIRNLGPLGPESMAVLKDGEQEKRKSYAAVCWLPRAVTINDLDKINALGREEAKDLEIEQWTPLRVLHRRPNLCRRRAVHEMQAEMLPELPPGYFLLKLTTAAGTYVKEFVHGDRGRTTPCMKDILGCSSAECVYLDVTGVDFNF
jgi:tRNA pseudouridine synthase 10